jgi:hypothetical protein
LWGGLWPRSIEREHNCAFDQRVLRGPANQCKGSATLWRQAFGQSRISTYSTSIEDDTSLAIVHTLYARMITSVPSAAVTQSFATTALWHSNGNPALSWCLRRWMLSQLEHLRAEFISVNLTVNAVASLQSRMRHRG